MFYRLKVRGGNRISVTLVSADNIIGAFGQAREEMEKCEVNLVSIVKVGLRKHNPLILRLKREELDHTLTFKIGEDQ
jgi:hypothetical protein